MLAAGCSTVNSEPTAQTGGAAGIGGSAPNTTGGALSTGGNTGNDASSGGASPTGGARSSGGASSLGTGGAPGTARAKNSGGSGANNASGGTLGNTGGTKNTGGVTLTSSGGAASPTGGVASASGGTKNTGGTLSATGGAKNTGGTSTVAPTGGVAATGGRASTGGASALPTGLPVDCGARNCDDATPVNPQLTSYGALGNVTMYSTGPSKGGACIYQDTKILYYAAININIAPGDAKGQWKGGTICGQCFEVTVVTKQGYKSVVVRVTDKCPDGSCGMDLGGSAPAAVMVDGIGRYQGAWRAVTCAGHPEVSDGPPSIHVKDGSSSGWAAIQVRNPTMAVAGIDYKDEMNGSIAGSMGLAPGIENYYLVPTDALASFSTIDITVRYVDGSMATAAIASSQLGTANSDLPLN